MLLPVVSLVLSLSAAPQEDAAIAPQCSNVGDPSQQLPEMGLYLMPTRFEGIVPVNTSIWLLERASLPHAYKLFDTTSNRTEVQLEVERTGLLKDVLVELRPTRELMPNHRMEVLQDDMLIASFTPNVVADHTAPAALTATILPASQTFESPCLTPGFHVQLNQSLSEIGLILVEDAGEPIAVSQQPKFFVSSLQGSVHQARVVAVDLAGNRSAPSAETKVTADQAMQTNFSGGRNTSSVQPCTCVATRRQLQFGLAPLLLGAIGLLRRRRAA